MIGRKKRKKRATRTSRRNDRIRGKRVFVFALAFSLGAVFFAPFTLRSFPMPDVGAMVETNPKSTALIRQRAEEAVERGRPFQRDQQWVSLDKVSPHLIHAVIVLEDASFYDHDGFDTHELKESIEKNWKEKRWARGASTISQQLTKNLWFGTERTIQRKLAEAVATWRMERALTKDRILELYLNVIEWGDGVYGAEAASRHYFGRSAGELDPRQAALLAAMIPSPREWDPSRPTTYLSARADQALEWMKLRGWIGDSDLARHGKG